MNKKDEEMVETLKKNLLRITKAIEGYESAIDELTHEREIISAKIKELESK